ncbi:exported hypothetical protein [uncultured Paludibacter sp.]|uniref:PKD domain-containing protein n=1 Tax=uncultured Paludibacter sp. TaxID=497635 RepID=A0A653AFJ1_9BACT|nr:exported hypothetical protein [uncultured Paludibacter sp.]
MRKLIIIILALIVFIAFSPPIWSQNTIKTIEFWTDGNSAIRTQRNLTPNTTYNWEELIDLSTIIDGVHTFNVRFSDDGGLWSNVQSHFFLKQTNAAGQSTFRKINGLEFWVDGNSTARVQRNLTASTPYNWEELLDYSAISDGVHTFNVRFSDDGGLWSNVQSHFFFKNKEDILTAGENKIVGYRIWYSEEPDFIDNFSVDASQSLTDINDSISVTYLPKGEHQIVYQLKDLRGVWSPAITDSITKTDNPLFSFLADKREIVRKDSVRFTPSTVLFIDSIVWDFGDGFTEVSFEPEHVYDSIGQFDVAATVWHKGSTEGISYVEIKYIAVTPTGLFTPKVYTLKMYPVPVKNELTIESPSAQMKSIRVINLNGTVLQNIRSNSPEKTKLLFDGFPSATYIIVVETDQGIMSNKVVKK